MTDMDLADDIRLKDMINDVNLRMLDALITENAARGDLVATSGTITEDAGS
jgi:hypothetical protein